jgi:hypothetical protein
MSKSNIQSYGIDISSTLESLLVQELTDSINSEFLKKVMQIKSRSIKSNNILEKIKKMKNYD